MATGEVALWGLVGGLVVEILDLLRGLRSPGGGWRWPHSLGRPASYLSIVVVKLGCSAGFATFARSSGDEAWLAAAALGASVPMFIERIARFAPHDRQQEGGSDDRSPGGRFVDPISTFLESKK